MLKKRILSLVICILFTLSLSTVALAKNSGGGGKSSGGKSSSSSSNANSSGSKSGSGSEDGSVSNSGDTVNEEDTANVTATEEDQQVDEAEDGAETGDGDDAAASAGKENKKQLKTQAKEQLKEQVKAKIQERVETTNSGEVTGTGLAVKVKVRGYELQSDVPPVIKSGRTLIPVRAIMNGMGADVAWDAETPEIVTITKDGTTVVLTLGSNVITVNGVEQTMDVPAQLISNRTFVPIRFVAQALNMNVGWDEETGTVDIGDGTETGEEEGAEETTGQETGDTSESDNSDTVTGDETDTDTGEGTVTEDTSTDSGEAVTGKTTETETETQS